MTDIALSRFIPRFDVAESPLLTQSRLARIDRIMKKDEEMFRRWSNQPSTKLNLNMPYQAWRYLIPQPVFALAKNPERVQILALDRNSRQQDLLIVERDIGPVSSRLSLDNYKDALRIYVEKRKAASPDERANFVEPERPDDVDRFHALHYSLIRNGKLKITDYVINEIMLSSRGKRLHVSAYRDREELHHFGIATTFYEQLYYIAKALGYRFVTGRNKNPGFFINRLGKKPASELKPEYQNKFLPQSEEVDPAEFTIRFLYPEDEQRYLKNEFSTCP